MVSLNSSISLLIFTVVILSVVEREEWEVSKCNSVFVYFYFQFCQFLLHKLYISIFGNTYLGLLCLLGGLIFLSLYNVSLYLLIVIFYILKSLLCACMLNCFSYVQLFAALWTVTRQAPLPMGFSRQEYQSGLPCPSPGDLPDPGIEPGSPAWQVDSLSLHHLGSPQKPTKQVSGSLSKPPS